MRRFTLAGVARAPRCSRSPPRRARSPMARLMATATPRLARCSRHSHTPTAPGRPARDADLTDVFLTAAHCDQGVSRVAVTFDSSYNAATGTVLGHLARRPGYNQAQSDPQDVAVVVFDKAVKGITPARLPKAGSLNNLSVGTRFTAVGYGAQSVTIDQGPTFHYADIRYVATGGLHAVNPSWLRISMNPAAVMAARATGIRVGRTSLARERVRPTSWPARRSPATSCAGRPTTTTAWTPPSARAFLGQYVTLP